ncbi:MarR family winged helix-turn-helix transcriptional regulator [Fluviicola sp.]|uniref:MarR family winged helix-turn-helix transcriptional regulator n=1 Tax=Fluviicola sp. TaxID=1917219 RepID=UPI003D2962E9
MESTLVQLIKQYEEYKQSIANDLQGDSLTGFLLFMNKRLGKTGDNGIDFGISSWENFNRQTLTEMASAFIGKMGRYVDNYARKAMPKTQVASIEEFTYLIVMLQEQSMTKSELINHNAHQITTGTEIIKRLIGKGYLEQTDDLRDKRSVRVSITDKGRIAVYSTASTTKSLSTIATGILSDEELLFLVNTLRKLDDFHKEIFQESKHLELDELVEKHLKD